MRIDAGTFELDRRDLLRLGAAGVGIGAVVGSYERAAQGATASSTEGWHGYQSDMGNSGYAPAGAAPTSELSVQRTFEVAHEREGSPVVVDGRLYTVADDEFSDASGRSQLRAFDTTTGEEQWRQSISAPTVAQPLVVADGRVFVSDEDISHVFAFDAATGEGYWSREIADGSIVYEPTAEVVFCQDVALDAATGEVHWGAPARAQSYSVPAAAGGRIFYVDESGALRAVSATDGSQHWRRSFDATGSPTVVDGVLYQITDYQTVGAYDPADGSTLWEQSSMFDHQDAFGSPAVTGDGVYVAAGPVVALDPSDGSLRWQNDSVTVWDMPIAVGDVVYALVDAEILAFDAVDGSIHSRLELDKGGGALAFAAGSLYVGSREGVRQLGGEGGEASLSLTIPDETVEPGGTVTIEFVLTNEGDATSTGIEGTLFPETERWELAETPGSFTSLGPGETETVTATFHVPGDAEGEYDYRGTVEDDAGNTASDDAVVVVEQPLPPAHVADVDGDPVADATVQLFAKGVYTETKSEGRTVVETNTAEDGGYTLPTTFADSDDALVLVARRGDWFATRVYDPGEIDSSEDYGGLTLDRQLLSGPRVVRAPNGDPFGTVTVWRYLHDESTQVFYTEVTNTSVVDPELWKILETGAVNGPLGGNFLFSFPETETSIVEESDFAGADPTGDGGVAVFATHPPQTRFCCNSRFDLPDPLEPSPAGFFHPARDHAALPLYETTKRLGRFRSLEDPPNQAAGWHPLTPESTERAAQIEDRLEKGLEFPAKACDLVGVSCGLGFLLDANDGLRWINKVLDGGPRVARETVGADSPIVGGGTPSGEYDVWRADMPAPFADSHEASIVHQAPLERRPDDAITYSVQAEWARPYNNRGQFSATVSTGPIEVTIHESEPDAAWIRGEPRSLDVGLRNRSLETQSIDRLVLSADTQLQTARPDVTLAPGESIRLSAVFSASPPGAGPFEVEVQAHLDGETVASRTNVFEVGTDPTAPAFDVEPSDPVVGTSLTLGFTSEGEGRIQRYEWDLDGDGVFETAGREVSHTFETAGRKFLTLRVVDDAGSVDLRSESITVRAVGTDDYPPALTPHGRPTNLDDDALLEDVDGDGQAGLADVRTYIDKRNSDVIENNPEYFDFDGDGVSGELSDAYALWNEVV